MFRRCPACRFQFNRVASGDGGMLFRPHYECPNCRVKLRPDKASSRIKGIGGLIALIGVVLFEGNWDLPDSYLSAWWIFIVLGTAVIFVGVRRMRWELVE